MKHVLERGDELDHGCLARYYYMIRDLSCPNFSMWTIIHQNTYFVSILQS